LYLKDARVANLRWSDQVLKIISQKVQRNILVRVLHPGLIGVWIFVEGEKVQKPENNTVSRARTNNTWHQVRIEPGTHWWEVSSLTTATSLLTTTHVMYTCTT